MSGADPIRAKLRLWLRLLAAAQDIERDIQRRLREHGQTLPRFDCLATLDRAPDGLSMGELSARLRVSNGNVTGVVDRLVREGLAERSSPPDDRRRITIALTPTGRALFATLLAQHNTWIDEILAGMDPAEIETLTQLLQKTRASAALAARRTERSEEAAE
jgi:DNA-binding MarR family transcriptional regulator